VRSAVPSLLFVLVTAVSSTNAWSAKNPPIRVEAMVGEAVVVFEDIDCPEEVVTVPTGEVAQTNPTTCETIVALSTVSDKVNAMVWAIAAADPDDPAAAAAIQAQLAGLTTAEQTLVIVVLHNNAQHLGTNDQTIISTIGSIVAVNPRAAATLVMTASVLDPGNSQAIIEAATVPGQTESVQQGAAAAEDIRQDFEENQQGGPGGDDYDGGAGVGETPVEVISVTDPPAQGQPQQPPPNVRPPPNNQVPPGGAIPVTPTPTPSATPTPTPTATPTPTPTATPTPTPTASPTPTPTATPIPTVSPTPTPPPVSPP